MKLKRKAFCLSNVVRILKETAIDKSMSDEEFLRELLDPFIECGNIKNRKGDKLDIDKTRTSRIMNNKENVPFAIKKAISKIEYENNVNEEIGYFVEEILDQDNKESTVFYIECKI